MEWQLPIQKVEIGNINIGSPWLRDVRKEFVQKPMAPLSYFGTHFRLPFISLMFPPLTVSEYVPASGKLVLDMSDTNLASIKLNTLQETLVNAIMYHQSNWFNTNFTKEEVKDGFQPIIQNNQLYLHCPLILPRQGKGIPLFKGEWKTLSPEDLKDAKIRVAIKIHGISFLNRQGDTWSGRCRLQHRIVGIIVQG